MKLNSEHLFELATPSRIFYFCGNLGNVKGKPTRKTCFSREMKRLAIRIYLAKFC